MGRILDGDRAVFKAAVMSWDDTRDFPSARPLRKLFTADGVGYVLWVSRSDLEKPVMISRIPEAYWRFII